MANLKREKPARAVAKTTRQLPGLLPPGYAEMLADIKSRIKHAQVRAATAAYRELVRLYWDIGREIVLRQGREGWGNAVVDRLAADLQRAFPGTAGFSPQNIWYMRAFYLAWTEDVAKLQQPVGELDGQNVPQVAGQIPWGHNLQLIAKVKDPRQRLWYAEKVVQHGWSRAVLVHQIELDLYGREGQAITNYYIHLLFYHLRLRAFVVIDLKVEEFRPEFAGKMNFYLSAVDDRLRHPEDQSSIGLILCKARNKVTVEYALRDTRKPIGVSKYRLTAALPHKLKSSLPTIEQLEEELKSAAPSASPPCPARPSSESAPPSL